MNLTTLFAAPQLTGLLHASDTELVLGCLDPQTGQVTRVTVKADMVALPEEALLFTTVEEEAIDFGPPPDEDNNDYDDCDGGEPFMFDVLNYMADEIDPPDTWTITPRGEEIDLRDCAGGLF